MGGRTETFLATTARMMPGVIGVLHDKPAVMNTEPVFSEKLPARLFAKIRRTLKRESFDQWALHSYQIALESLQPDVVLAQYGMTGAWLTPICKRLSLPIVLHFHGIDASANEIITTWRQAYREAFHYAGATVAVSQKMRDDLIQLGAPPERVVICPYGFSPARFQQADINSNDPILLAVGRLVEKKSPINTLRAFSVVAQQHKKALLQVVGDGPLRERCVQFVQEHGLQDRVRFMGPLDHDQVAMHMKKARIFVQHSVRAPNGDCEGTPVAIIEALACGLPVVSTKHAGIPDVVQHGQSGWLVDEGDFESMARHILDLLNNNDRCATMGAHGRQNAYRDYTDQASTDRLHRVIADVALDQPVSHLTHSIHTKQVA